MIVLLTALRAQAWNHTGYVWELQDAPLQVIVDPTMPAAEEWLAAFQDAADAWAAAPTALTLTVEMAESGPLLPENTSSGQIPVMEDLGDVIGADVPSVTYSYPSGEVAYSSYLTYLYLDDSDIIINDTETFVGIDEPCEGDENIREVVAIHNLGHALGLDHSCEEYDICADELLASAVMYWNPGDCTNRTPNEDDLEGLGQLYDASGTWVLTSDDYVGKTPREVCFAIAPNNIDADHVEWDFGDGTTGEGDETCHTFETPGETEVEVRYFSEFDDRAPRAWSETIMACQSPPVPIAGATQLFDLRTFGTQIEIVPTVDARYPCVDSVRWSVLEGDETLYDLPVSKSLVDVGKYGEYTVVLRTGGYGGVAEEEQTITLAEDGGGCSSVHPRGGVTLLSLVLAALGTRRSGTRPENRHGARNSRRSGAR